MRTLFATLVTLGVAIWSIRAWLNRTEEVCGDVIPKPGSPDLSEENDDSELSSFSACDAR